MNDPKSSLNVSECFLNEKTYKFRIPYYVKVVLNTFSLENVKNCLHFRILPKQHENCLQSHDKAGYQLLESSLHAGC